MGQKPRVVGPKTLGTASYCHPQISKVGPETPENLKVGPRDPQSMFKSWILGPHHSLMNSNFFQNNFLV